MVKRLSVLLVGSALHPRKILVLFSVKGVNSRAIMRLEGLDTLKKKCNELI
jgi:hypothetical protein